MKYAALFSLLLLTACLTVEDSPGVTHKASIVRVDYAHVFASECLCFDDAGNVLPACIGEPDLPTIIRNGVVVYDPRDYFKK